MSHHRKYDIRPSKQLESNSLKNLPTPMQMPVTLSFIYVKPGDLHCICLCQKDELKEISNCFRKLTTLTWTQVLQQGGKHGNKTGLGYTVYDDSDLRTVKRPAGLSQEIAIGAVRASQKSRVFGGHKNHIFYVLWFDRNHEIVPV